MWRKLYERHRESEGGMRRQEKYTKMGNMLSQYQISVKTNGTTIWHSFFNISEDPKTKHISFLITTMLCVFSSISPIKTLVLFARSLDFDDTNPSFNVFLCSSFSFVLFFVFFRFFFCGLKYKHLLIGFVAHLICAQFEFCRSQFAFLYLFLPIPFFTLYFNSLSRSLSLSLSLCFSHFHSIHIYKDVISVYY